MTTSPLSRLTENQTTMADLKKEEHEDLENTEPSDNPSQENAQETPAPSTEETNTQPSENTEPSGDQTSPPSPEEQITALQDQILRMKADFDNFRKRLTREKEESIKFANLGLFEELLPIVDNFELGLTAAETADDTKSIVLGLNMVKDQMKRFLTDSGLSEVPAEKGADFDPHIHDAVAHEEQDDLDEGKIIYQRRKGYSLKDRLIRPATVVVAKKKESETSTE